ncbi:TPA: hypothetical protein ACFM4P_002110, partial [Neisseria meningitidis]
DRHSRKSGNPKTQRNRNPSEKTETPPTVIPAKAGIQQHNAAGIYRKKQKPPPTVIPAKAGIQQPKNHRNLSAKTETPTAVIPAKAGIQTRRHGNLPNKTVSLDSTSQIPALYDALYQRGALIFLTFPFDSQVKGAFLCQQ